MACDRWDRLVRAAKEPLHLGKPSLTYQKLVSVITRIEAIINTRPLTTVSGDVRDFSSLNRAHLTLGRPVFNLPDIQKDDSINENATRQCYRNQQRIVNYFWKRWRGQYLNQLSVCQRWPEEQPALKVGDVVLISEDNLSKVANGTS